MDRNHHGKPVNLNLLVALEALFEHRSVTAAAASLGVRQSTLSHSLAQLREQLDDRLFVKGPMGLEPTPRALTLAEPLRQALDTVRTRVLRRAAFDPSTSTRSFTLCMTEVAEAVFLPRILAHLGTVAPGIRLRTVMLDYRQLEQALAQGEVDLAIGYFPDFKGANIYQQVLFPHGPSRAARRSYMCLVDAGHPRVGKRLTTRDFLSERHIRVGPVGRSYEMLDHELARRKLRLQVVLSTPYFTSLPILLANSDLLAVVPTHIGETYARLGRLKSLPLPFQMPNFDPKQHWHARLHDDIENRWLRQAIARLHGREADANALGSPPPLNGGGAPR